MTNSGAPSDGSLELRGTFGSRTRKGNWSVPGRLIIHQRMGSTELDFTQASFASHDVTIDVDMVGGSIELRVPDGTAVDVAGVKTTLASVQDHRKAAPTQGDIRIRIAGRLIWGSLEVRGPRG